MHRAARVLSSVGAIALASGLLHATPALAHTPTATPGCTGLTVAMTGYSGPGTPNLVTVVIDASVVTDTSFGETYSHFFPWSDTQTHSWSVVVDGVTPDGDATFSGTQEACVSTTSTATTEAPASSEVATTTGAASSTTEAPESSAATSTTDVDSAGPTPTTLVGDSTGLLPETGGHDQTWLATGAGAVLLGMGLIMATRRRTT